MSDDPFGLNNPERTQWLRPQPGGQGPPGVPAPELPAKRSPGGTLPSGTPGRGPLVQAAYGLLALATRLRSRSPPSDLAVLRQRVEEELRRFEEQARASGVDDRLVKVGHYALCALIDDVVLNTPWGALGIWKSQSLAGTLHHDVAAGERFFDLLDKTRREPERHRPLLELLHACLALGFEGKYRLHPVQGTTSTAVREDLAAQLRRLQGPPSSELSAQWQGIAARHAAIGERIPLWVAATATLLVLAVLYTGFRLRLGDYDERLGLLVAALPQAVAVERPPVHQAVALQPPPASTALRPQLQTCLARAGLPSDGITEDLQRIRIRLPNAGMFASGQADLAGEMEPVIRCIGQVLERESGRILVLGHSDNVPIRTARFPSNWELSSARAEAVERVLRQVVSDRRRLTVRGLADTEPIGSNDTAAGRAQNRRVEILLLN